MAKPVVEDWRNLKSSCLGDGCLNCENEDEFDVDYASGPSSGNEQISESKYTRRDGSFPQPGINEQ